MRIGMEDGYLIVTVADDGIGGATATPAGIGLAGLADRIAALDGELTITSPRRRERRSMPRSRSADARRGHAIQVAMSAYVDPAGLLLGPLRLGPPGRSSSAGRATLL